MYWSLLNFSYRRNASQAAALFLFLFMSYQLFIFVLVTLSYLFSYDAALGYDIANVLNLGVCPVVCALIVRARSKEFLGISYYLRVTVWVLLTAIMAYIGGAVLGFLCCAYASALNADGLHMRYGNE